MNYKKLVQDCETKQEEINAIQKQIDDIDAQALSEVMKENLGKTYIYENSYGSGDTWFLYVEILGMEEDHYNIRCFEKTSHDEISIEKKTLGHYSLESYTYLPRDEFDLAAQGIIRECLGREYK